MLKTELSIMNNHRNQLGFTLLEVLITLIILSIGLLGLAGLQTISLRNNHGAYLHSQAITQAYDIVDRMRTNTNQIGAYTLANSTYTFDKIGTQTAACDTTSGCATAQMAGHDLFKWNQANRSILPQGIGIVCRAGSDTPSGDCKGGIDDGVYTPATDIITKTCCTNLAADPLVVKIWWTDDRTNDSPVASHLSIVIGDKL